MFAKKIAIVPLLGVLLAGNAQALFGINLGGEPTKPADPLEVQDPNAMKGKSALAVGSFKVSFVTFDKSSATATSSMFSSDSGFAKMTLRSRLVGVDDQTFQAITDTAYQDFLQTLRANGYQVIDRARIESAPSYAKLGVTPNPHKETSSFTAVTGGSREEATFSPTGLPLYHEGEFGAAPRPVPFQVHEIAQESGVSIINVHYLVHFAYFSGDTSNFGGTKTASMNMAQTVRVEHGSQMVLTSGWGDASTVALTWGNYSDKVYGTASEATSDAQTAANAFSSVMGVFSGGSMSAKEYNIDADPAKYAESANDVISQTNEQFVKKLASLR